MVKKVGRHRYNRKHDAVTDDDGIRIGITHDAQVKRNRELYGYPDWYEWCINNWGTKWDVEDQDANRVDANNLETSFDSAWAPPCTAYERLCELGFEITAYYYEPGMGFVGKWSGDPVDYTDDYYELSGQTSETVRGLIGDELDDQFGIADDMAMWEEDD